MSLLRGHWIASLREPLTIGVAVSLALHALVLAVRFTQPEPIRLNAQDSRLEVVLLNARTERRPDKADVLAQVNMEAGGEHEQGRAQSPLKADRQAVDGTGLVEQRRRVEELEEQQRRLSALARGPQSFVERERPTDDKAATAPGADPTDVDTVPSRRRIAAVGGTQRILCPRDATMTQTTNPHPSRHFHVPSLPHCAEPATF